MNKPVPLEERETSVLLLKILCGCIVLCGAVLPAINGILLFFASDTEALQVTLKGSVIVDLTRPGCTPVWVQMIFQAVFVFCMLFFAWWSIVPPMRVLKKRKNQAQTEDAK